jgi:hypothetical protein
MWDDLGIALPGGKPRFDQEVDDQNLEFDEQLSIDRALKMRGCLCVWTISLRW